eukprot:jgi/Tetstr1/464878/TSEL_009615.t1
MADLSSELGVTLEVIAGDIVTAGVDIKDAVAGTLWDLRWSGYIPDYKKDIPHVQGILDSTGAYRGVKQTAVNSKKRQNKKHDSVAIGQKKESFIGKECIKLVGKYEELLEHIKETYKTVSDGNERKAHKVWGLWRQLWALLLEPVDPQERDYIAATRGLADGESEKSQEAC